LIKSDDGSFNCLLAFAIQGSQGRKDATFVSGIQIYHWQEKN
jgi:hypothetical protein